VLVFSDVRAQEITGDVPALLIGVVAYLEHPRRALKLSATETRRPDVNACSLLRSGDQLDAGSGPQRRPPL
jgi:hypothetical protein